MTQPLTIWTVYDHPKDFPNTFVARKFLNDQPTNDIMVSAKVEDIRDVLVQMGLTCLIRSPEDDPKIMETWL